MTTHRMYRTLTYRSWAGMKVRCNKESKKRKFYYDKGITVCDEWKSFEGFYKDMGDRPDGMSIDRIDNSKGYYKENCKWSTKQEQAHNRDRTIKYKGESARDASRRLNGCDGLVCSRIKKGWDLETAFNTPVGAKPNKNNILQELNK